MTYIYCACLMPVNSTRLSVQFDKIIVWETRIITLVLECSFSRCVGWCIYVCMYDLVKIIDTWPLTLIVGLHLGVGWQELESWRLLHMQGSGVRTKYWHCVTWFISRENIHLSVPLPSLLKGQALGHEIDAAYILVVGVGLDGSHRGVHVGVAHCHTLHGILGSTLVNLKPKFCRVYNQKICVFRRFWYDRSSPLFPFLIFSPAP